VACTITPTPTAFLAVRASIFASGEIPLSLSGTVRISRPRRLPTDPTSARIRPIDGSIGCSPARALGAVTDPLAEATVPDPAIAASAARVTRPITV
jgi:hypothetical protein